MTEKNTNQDTRKFCTKCEKDKRPSDFYKSFSPLHNGHVPVCKTCIKNQVNTDNIESVKDMLRMIDRPFIESVWETSLNEKGSKAVFGIYIKNIGMNHYKYMTWADTDKPQSSSEEVTPPKPVQTKKEEFEITDEMIRKWGYGYLPEEIKAFEHKYSMLKNNYQEKTAMHTEALLTYIRYRVKEEIATAKNDMKSAKEWGQLAQKAATDAKINPSQLSKSDLSDGLDTFGQLVRSVEQAVDIIPILPSFKERPQDKVDFTIWCYINYIRDLKGLPLAEYEDVYNFYEERKKEFENRDEV